MLLLLCVDQGAVWPGGDVDGHLGPASDPNAAFYIKIHTYFFFMYAIPHLYHSHILHISFQTVLLLYTYYSLIVL